MRLFAAIELPAAAREAVAGRVEEARAALPPAAWVRAANLHVTLVFFGEVAEKRIGDLAAALSGAAAGCGALTLEIRGAGAFPSHGRVRVVWLAVEPAEQLAALAERLRRAAREAGIAFDEKAFASHLTLARCRRPWPVNSRRELARLEPATPTRFVVREAKLLASELSPDGARYCEVARLPLEAAA